MNSKRNSSTIGVRVVILLLLAVIGGWAWGVWHTRAREIILSDRGFAPKVVFIRQGAVVAFHTSRGKYYWPASDPHPIHSDYGEFDAGRALHAGESWKFGFNRVGVWRYHDHLAPQFSGVIVVLGWDSREFAGMWKSLGEHITRRIPETTKEMDAYYARCGGLNKDCWDPVFTSLVETRGPKSALKTIAYLRQNYPDFANYCHQYTDFTGELSYWNVSPKKRLPEFDPDLAGQCSSGYLHGYMGEFASHGSISQGISFCDALSRAYPQSEVAYECYRGVGNGLAFRFGLSSWNDEEKIVQDALEVCAGVKEAKLCEQGVIIGLDHMYFGVHGFQLRMNADRPFGVCDRVKPELTDDCYEQLSDGFFAFVGHDLDKAAPYIAKLSPKHAAIVIPRVIQIPYELVTFDSDGYDRIVAWCRRAPFGLSETCLKGFIEKLLTIDLDYNGHTAKANEFCGMSLLTAKERDFCVSVINERR